LQQGIRTNTFVLAPEPAFCRDEGLVSRRQIRWRKGTAVLD
jgi:hypothetical protein